MGRRRKDKPRLIPEQDKRICGSICLCQLTIVLSCVSLVYLTVAVYMPSHKAFNYGIEPVPVMCQAVNTTLVNNCDWASCGEWCLTKTTGFCPQIHVTTRRNGTDVTLEECTRLATVSCPPANPAVLKRFNCNNDKECATLTGIFNCSLGHCANMSKLYLCHHKADGIIVDSDKDNLKLNGFFECYKSRCTKIKRGFYCDRYCNKITTTAVNVYLQYENSVYTGTCKRLIAHNRSNGSEVGSVIEPTEIWTDNGQLEVLLASCHKVQQVDNTLRATDCINGTLLNEELVPEKFMNFTTYWSLVANSTRLLDPEQHFLPMQHVLTIYNYSRLYINLEGCVNTLRGECREFLNTHGSDGDNNTAQSRFHCFYKKDHSYLVLARFDLDKTWRELMIAIFLPSTLFIISFIALVVIAHSVKVGDDTVMRCQLCPQEDPSAITEDLAMDGVLHTTESITAMDNRANLA